MWINGFRIQVFNANDFQSEVILGYSTAFTSCCHKGKAILPPLSQNEYFKTLYDGLISNEPSIKRKSKNYFENNSQIQFIICYG